MKHISWNIVDFTAASRPVLRSNEYANSIVLFILSQERIKGHETLMRQDTGIENDLVFQSSNRATQLFLFRGIQLLCFQCRSSEFIIFITNSKLTLLSWATTWESHKTVIPDTSGAWYTVLKRDITNKYQQNVFTFTEYKQNYYKYLQGTASYSARHLK